LISSVTVESVQKAMWDCVKNGKNLQLWSELLAPLVIMIKESCKNIEPFIEVKELKSHYEVNAFLQNKSAVIISSLLFNTFCNLPCQDNSSEFENT